MANVRGRAEGLRATRARTRRPNAVRSGPHAAAAAGGLAPATGLTMPVLDRLRRFYEEHTSDDDALRAARALLVTGVADPADWRRAKGDHVEYMRRMLSRWVAQGYGDMRKHPGTILTLHLSPETDRWYVGMWVDRVHQVPLGAMVRLLEQYHPRLPATVVRIFNEAVWKVGYAFGASEYE